MEITKERIAQILLFIGDHDDDVALMFLVGDIKSFIAALEERDAKIKQVQEKNTAQAKQLKQLTQSLHHKKKVFFRASRRALANRRHETAELEKKVKIQGQEIIRLEQKASVRQHKECGKKVTFRDRATADKRAEQAGHRVYHCSQCSKWHLTSKS